jgi:hypothetical protein
MLTQAINYIKCLLGFHALDYWKTEFSQGIVRCEHCGKEQLPYISSFGSSR